MTTTQDLRVHGPDRGATRRRPGPSQLLPIASTAAGEAFGVAFGALARLRRNRPLHPRGTTYAARVTVHGGGDTGGDTGGEDTGVPWLDESATHEATLRVSRSAGLPGWLPDVYGVALRLGRDTATPVDLLFSTAWRSTVGRFLLAPRFTVSGVALTTLWPVRSPAGPLLLRLEADEARPTEAGSVPSTLRLSGVIGRGPWHEAGVVSVGPALPTPVDQERHDAVLHELPGTQQYDAVRRFREPSYRAARAAHPRPPAKPLP